MTREQGSGWAKRPGKAYDPNSELKRFRIALRTSAGRGTIVKRLTKRPPNALCCMVDQVSATKSEVDRVQTGRSAVEKQVAEMMRPKGDHG